MYEEGDIADGPNGPLIFQGGQWVPMGTSAPASTVIKRADPRIALAVLKDQADLAKAAREAANAPIDMRKATADANKAEAEAALAQAKLAKGDQGGGQSGATRASAIAGYKTAQQLRGVIRDIENLDAAGPGATKGLAGLADYLPLTANQRLDTAGNSARGIVGQALGFTGGQLNTEREAAMAIGPYLPQASDRDEVRADKIARLKQLADVAEGRAISVLGGRPDDNGTITPVTAATQQPAPPQPPAPGSDRSTSYYGNNPNGGGGMALATGTTQSVTDPVLRGVNAKVNSLLKSGAPDREIVSYLQQVGADAAPASVAAALAFRRKNPGYKGDYSVDLETRDVPMSSARQAFQAIGAGPVGAYATSAADALTAGRMDNIAGAVGGSSAQVNAAKDLLAKANPLSSIAGNMTGGALAALGTEAALARSGLTAAGGVVGRLARSPYAADAAYGAAVGSDQGGITGALTGAALGTIGGYTGDRAVGALRGVQNDAVNALRQRGIPLTLGQAVGQSGRVGAAVKGLEDRLSGLPVVGAMLNARRLEGVRGFNRAALNEAAAPLQRQATPLDPVITATGPEGVDALRAARSAGYDNAVNGRFAIADPIYDQAYDQALNAAGSLPNTGPAVRAEIGAAVPGYFAAGAITGSNAQAALRELRMLRRARQTDPLGYRTGQAIRQAEDAVTGLFDRQSPGFTNDLARANEVQTNLKTIEVAASNAANQAEGLFTPAQLNRASVGSANRLTGSGATPDRPFYDLTTQGQAVLPNAVPDSGTAGRLLLGSAFAGGGAGAGYLGGDTQKGLAVGSALAALQTQAAQRALVAAVLDRPRVARQAAELLHRYGVGSALGGATAVQALPR